MTEAEAREAVCQRWKDVWDTLHPAPGGTCPYTFENKKDLEPDPRTSWARVEMTQADSNQHSLGAPGQRTWRREALVMVHLFRPLDDGTNALSTLCDEVRAVYEGVTFYGVQPNGSPRMQTVGSDGNWYQITMICPIQYFETR